MSKFRRRIGSPKISTPFLCARDTTGPLGSLNLLANCAKPNGCTRGDSDTPITLPECEWPWSGQDCLDSRLQCNWWNTPRRWGQPKGNKSSSEVRKSKMHNPKRPVKISTARKNGKKIKIFGLAFNDRLHPYNPNSVPITFLYDHVQFKKMRNEISQYLFQVYLVNSAQNPAVNQHIPSNLVELNGTRVVDVSEDGGLVLTGGQLLDQPLDFVLFCTGYRFCFPFLVQSGAIILRPLPPSHFLVIFSISPQSSPFVGCLLRRELCQPFGGPCCPCPTHFLPLLHRPQSDGGALPLHGCPGPPSRISGDKKIPN